MSKKRLWTAAAAIVALAAVATVGALTTRAGASNRALASTTKLDPANLAALTNANTAVFSAPPQAATFGALRPTPGSVHQLGHGAVGWIAQGRTCWIGRGAGGCVADASHAFTWTYRDPDLLGSGSPGSVFGLAADNVTKITVSLRTGQTVSAAPAANFFDVPLPDGSSPDDLSQVTATLADGSAAALSAG